MIDKSKWKKVNWETFKQCEDTEENLRCNGMFDMPVTDESREPLNSNNVTVSKP